MDNKRRNLKHPVWEVYDDYRTAIMNVKIQKAELKRLRRLNFWIEIPLAISASSSVAGLWFWGTVGGGYALKILGLITAFLAVLKPLLKLPEKIQQRGEMLADFTALENDLEKIKKVISQVQKYDNKLRQQYFKVLDKKGLMKGKYTGIKSLENNKQIKISCAQEVTKEHPASGFYIPEE